jgi:hypothetical protein
MSLCFAHCVRKLKKRKEGREGETKVGNGGERREGKRRGEVERREEKSVKRHLEKNVAVKNFCTESQLKRQKIAVSQF